MMSACGGRIGSAMNVRINLGSLKDKEFAAKLQTEAAELERLACQRKRIVGRINEELKV